MDGNERGQLVGASFTIDPKEVHQLASPHADNPSRLIESARRAERLAVLVDNEWEDFTPEIREVFKALAYDTIREPSGIRERLRRWWHRKKLGRGFLRSREEMLAVVEYVYSTHRLIDTVLVAVEREDEEHQEKLAAAAEQAAAKQGDGRILTVEERREWLRGVSRRALN